MAHARQEDMHVQSVCSIGTVLVKDVYAQFFRMILVH